MSTSIYMYSKSYRFSHISDIIWCLSFSVIDIENLHWQDKEVYPVLQLELQSITHLRVMKVVNNFTLPSPIIR